MLGPFGAHVQSPPVLGPSGAHVPVVTVTSSFGLSPEWLPSLPGPWPDPLVNPHSDLHTAEQMLMKERPGASHSAEGPVDTVSLTSPRQPWGAGLNLL